MGKKHRFVIERHLEIYFEVIDRNDSSLAGRFDMATEGSQKEAYHKAKKLKDKLELACESVIQSVKDCDYFAVTDDILKKQQEKERDLKINFDSKNEANAI